VKKIMIALGIFSLVLAMPLSAAALEDLVEEVANGCQKELTTYCAQVTPGEGRVLACLYAYSGKLSGRCEYALYDAAAQLQRAVAALGYVANECDADLDKYCAKVPAGEGRLLDCLEKNQKNISKRCKTAIKDVGLK
jgi:hypothetical protein